MKYNVIFISSVILAFACIFAYSKPLQEDSASSNAAQLEYENGLDLLRRITRQAVPGNGNNGNGNTKMCKYKKGSWSACDPQTKFRTRTFTLRRGDAAICEEQKTIRKECKGKGGKKNKPRDREREREGKNRDRPRKKNTNTNNN